MYYKNKQKTSILATLDLLHVGKIQLDFTDPAGCTFFIQVKGRNYYLCAHTKEIARDWVIHLNRAKEARLQIGGLKLNYPENVSAIGGKVNDSVGGGGDNPASVDVEDDQVVPRVVMSAQRKRLKGLGKDDFSEMEKSLDNSIEKSMSPPSGSGGTGSMGSNPNSPNPFKAAIMRPTDLIAASQAVQQGVRVRWTKRRNALQNWTRRLSRWAKRLTMIRCIIKDDVVHLSPNEIHYQQDGSLSSDYGEIQPNFSNRNNPSYSSYPELYSEVSHFCVVDKNFLLNFYIFCSN